MKFSKVLVYLITIHIYPYFFRFWVGYGYENWRLKPMTKSTINDCLSKIKKRSWILHECENRISAHIETNKYLLEFGLHGTYLDSLNTIKQDNDNKRIDVNNLTLMQKELLNLRAKLLKFMDRLNLYEHILGDGPLKAQDFFEMEKYSQIRSKPILEVALDFARDSNTTLRYVTLRC